MLLDASVVSPRAGYKWEVWCEARVTKRRDPSTGSQKVSGKITSSR